jgi:ABC-type polysaccharide/polyol phosphate export permease
VTIPAIAAVQFVFTLGCAIGVAAINVFFRDIANVARHGLRLWFYLSPALYSIDQVAGNPTLHALMSLNPWTWLFESYRNAIYNETAPLWGALAILVVASLVLFGITTVFFKRVEPAFAKVL